jgi:hypothetical protein
LLDKFYDPGRTTSNGDVDPLNPPHYRENSWGGSCTPSGWSQYISEDDDKRMSAEFEEYLKGVRSSLEAALADSAKQILADHQTKSIEKH